MILGLNFNIMDNHSNSLLSGSESFTISNQPAGFSVIDFWRFQFSNLSDMQGEVGEFVVSMALGNRIPDNRASKRSARYLFMVYFQFSKEIRPSAGSPAVVRPSATAVKWPLYLGIGQATVRVSPGASCSSGCQ